MSGEEYSGVVGRELYISTTGTGKVSITMNVKDLIAEHSSRDEITYLLSASLFRHILKDAPDVDATSFNLTIEVPEEMLQNEWEKYFKLTDATAAEFVVTTDEVEDDLSLFIPKIIEIPYAD